LRHAVHKVFEENRRTGVGLVIWENGKVVIVGHRKKQRAATTHKPAKRLGVTKR